MDEAVDRIQLRDLSHRDLPAVAGVHMAAYPDNLLSRLGIEAVRRYYEWLLYGPHDMAARGCELDGSLAGFAFGGVFRGATAGYLRRNRGFLAWRLLSHPWLVGRKDVRERFASDLRWLGGKPAVPAATAIPTTQRPYELLAIGVLPQARQTGLARALVEDAETIARSNNYARIAATVEAGSPDAVEFYEQFGWEKVIQNGRWMGVMTRLLLD